MPKNFRNLYILALIWTSSLVSQSVHVPLDHWVYPFAERLQVRGIRSSIWHSAKPYSRLEVGRILLEAEKVQKKDPAFLSAAEQGMLKQLKIEFHQEINDLSNQQLEKEERHLFLFEDTTYTISIDGIFRENMQTEKFRGDRKTQTRSRTTLGGTVRGNLQESLGFYLFFKNTLIRGEDIQQEQFNPSLGEPVTISGENAFSDDASAYVMLELPWIELQLGRDRIQWGPGLAGNLMFSANSPRMDMFRIKAQYGRFHFISLHGKLGNSTGQKYVAAHRLEVKLKSWLIMGAGESVIYGLRDPEPMYMNPLMPYHIAEHHLGDQDNNTMGFDWTIYPVKNHKIYAELFIDDWTSAKNPLTYYGNKFAFLLGWHWCNPLGLYNLDFNLEYTRIEPFVYTHEDTINQYIHYDTPIGHWLGPDSDDLLLKGTVLLNRNFTGSLHIRHTRQGEMDIYTPHQKIMGKRKEFLSGAAESAWNVGMEIRVQLFQDAFLYASYIHRDIEQWNHQPGENRQFHLATLNLKIDY